MVGGERWKLGGVLDRSESGDFLLSKAKGPGG